MNAVFAVVAAALFGTAGGAMAATWLLGPLQRRAKRLEDQTANLHARLTAMESRPAAAIPVAVAQTEVTPAAPVALAETLALIPAIDRPTTSPTPVPLASSSESFDGEQAAPSPIDVKSPVDVKPAQKPAFLKEDLEDFGEPSPTRPPFQFPSIERIAMWIGASLGALLLSVGALLLIIVAAEAGIFGPGLRVGMAMAVGTLAWVGGAAIGKRSPQASSAMSAAGASAVFGAVWAATSLYALVPQTAGFLLLMLVVSATMAQAGRFNDRVLGTMTVLGGLLASMVIGGDGAGPKLVYALILNTAVVVLANYRRWPELIWWVGMGTAFQLIAFAAQTNPDHQGVALMGITLLTVPYAILLARRGVTDVMGMSALLAGASFVAMASPWTPALDEVFFDPRSGLPATTEGSSSFQAALGTLAIALPLWLSSRRANSEVASVTVSLAALLPLVAFATGWPADEFARVALPVAMLGLGGVVFLGNREVGRGLLPLLVLAPAFLPVMEGPVQAVTLGLGALALITTVAGFVSTTAAAATAALPATALAAAVIGSRAEGSWPFALCLVGIVGLNALPTLKRWPSEPLPELPWVGALSAPTALMPAAYLWWSGAFGEDVIGLLPLLSAATTLAIAAALVLAGRTTVQSTVFAFAVLGIITGVTLALPMQVQTRWLTVGWALESSALALIALRLRHPLLRWASVLLALTVAVRLLFNPWSLGWGDAAGWPILNWTLYTWGIPTVCLLITADALRRGAANDPTIKPVVPLLQLLAMMTGFALINVQVSHAFQESGPLELAGQTMLQGMVRSISWGAYGIGLLILGLILNSRMTRVLGFAFILLGALKVSLYDLWSLPGLIRVGSLLGLGFFLIVAAFLFERLVLRERKAPTGE